MDDDVGEYTSHSIQSRAAETAEENESHSIVTRPTSSPPSAEYSFCHHSFGNFVFRHFYCCYFLSLIAIKNCILYEIYILFCESGCDRSNYFIDFCRRSFSVTLVRTHISSAQHESRRRHSTSQWCQTTATVSIESAFLRLEHSLVPIRWRKKTVVFHKFLVRLSYPQPCPFPVRFYNQIIIMATTAIAATAEQPHKRRRSILSHGRNVDKVKWFSYLCSANLLLIFGENFYAGTSFRIINFTVFQPFFCFKYSPFISDSCISHFIPSQLSVVFNKLSVQRCLERRMNGAIQPVKMFACRIDWTEELRCSFPTFSFSFFFVTSLAYEKLDFKRLVYAINVACVVRVWVLIAREGTVSHITDRVNPFSNKRE